MELYGKFGDDTLEARFMVSIDFEDVEGFSYTSESTIDFAELKGVSEIGGGDPVYSMSDELKKIRTVLENFQSPHASKRMNVNVYDSGDRLKAKKQRDELRRVRQKNENEAL